MPIAYRIAVIAAFVVSLWAPGAVAKVSPVFQQEIERVCRTVNAAKSPAELQAAEQAHRQRVSRAAEVARWQADRFTEHFKAEAEYKIADRTRHDLDVKLSDHLTPGREANLKQKLADAEKKLREVRGWERERDAKILLRDEPRPAAQRGDRDAYQREIDKLEADIARDKDDAVEALRAARKAHDDRIKDIDDLHGRKEAVYKAVTDAQDRWAAQLKEHKRVTSLADELEETNSSVLECIDRRRAVLEPGSDGAQLQTYLDSIERTIAVAEAWLARTNDHCRQLPQAIANLNAWSANVANRARTLAGQSPTSAALVQQHDRVLQEAINGANNAAAEIAQTRSRAAKAAADACAVAQIIDKDPRASDVSARLADARRHQAAAEKEVATAASELDRIRAAYAAAGQVSAQLAAASSAPAPAVTELQVTLRTIKQWQRGLEDIVSAAKPWAAMTVRAGDALDWLMRAPEGSAQRAFVERHRDRIEKLQARHKTLAEAPYCITRFIADVAGAAAGVSAAEALVNAIPAAARAAAPRPTLSPTAIETIFNSARGVADGTANEAVKAVRCVTAASVASQNLGIRCSYKRPDGSDIVVTLYDTQTCPKDIPGRFVDWKPEAKPDMMKDFSGKWFGHEPKFTYWTISGGTNVFSIVGHWQSDGRATAAKHDWTAECKRSADGTNIAECTGQGKYWDADKNAVYTMTLRLTLSDDGKSLHYNWKYGTVEFRTNAGVPRRHNDSIAPGRPDSGVMRR